MWSLIKLTIFHQSDRQAFSDAESNIGNFVCRQLEKLLQNVVIEQFWLDSAVLEQLVHRQYVDLTLTPTSGVGEVE